MGSFNTVVIEPNDEKHQNRIEVQFKHGLLRQIRYRVGDRLRWAPLFKPSPSDLNSDVPGVARLGSRAPFTFLDYTVRIRNGVIVEVVRADC